MYFCCAHLPYVLELHFDKSARLAGASMVTYLLEKSRLVGQGKNERSFHVFYQLLAGADDALKKVNDPRPASVSPPLTLPCMFLESVSSTCFCICVPEQERMH